MAAKKRQTMGKLMRERERAEKRARKQEKKDAKKAAREGGGVDPAQAETNGQSDENPLTPSLEPQAGSPDPPSRAVDEPDNLLR